MFEQQMSQSIEAGAPDITYSGNEGPKSPQQEQQMMEQQMMMQEQQMMAPVDYSSRAYRDKLIQQLMDTAGLDYGSAANEADRIIKIKLRPKAAYGGIMGLDGRRKYGLGSKFKKFVRKIIPNEVAKIAEVAAPFVAPFNPLAAGLMSGIGGFDRTGRIGSSIKSGLMNYGLGQGARYLGGADLQKGLSLKMPGATSGGGIGNYFSKPTGSNSRFFDNAFKSKSGPTTSTNFDYGVEDVLSDKQGILPGSESLSERFVKAGPTGIMETLKGFIPESTLGKVALGGGAIALGTALLGGGPEETVSAIMDRGEGLDIDGIRTEVIEAYKDSTGEKLLALRSKYPFLGTQASKNTAIMAMGGRIRRAEGGRINFKSGGSDIFGIGGEEVIPKMGEKMGEGASFLSDLITDSEGNVYTVLQYLRKFGEDAFFGGQKNPELSEKFYNKLGDDYIQEMETVKERGYNTGGIIGLKEGGLMNLGGMEKDYRAEGGFVPIGAKEKADDVPARLSVNEFVFTADAVRGAGQGDIDKGAEIMENMMKHLEQGGQVSEESQGMAGARDMFATSQRLSEVV